MPLRRVVALAQALTMILLLLPGHYLSSPASVQAASVPAKIGAVNVFDAVGSGIGCQAGTRKYKGPGLPKEPPWPPGAEPTPSPTPEPSPEPSLDPFAAEDPGASADPAASDEPTADAPMALLAAEVEVPLTQAAEPASEATPRPRRSRLIPGIDVSHHNGLIDYDAVHDAGHRFVFIKATQDNDFIDSMFPTNLANSKKAGLAAGAYHFFDYTLDGKAQADHFLDRVESVGGIDGALPPVVDVECWAPIGSSIHAVSATRLRDFVERVYERTARMPIIYTSVHMWREVVGNAEGFEDQPLWAACWGCDAPPSIAPGWDDWVFWQTGLSRIPGVGRLDGNYFSGKKKDLEAMKLRPFSIAGGADVAAGGRVELDLGGRDATHIRTSPDGDSWSEWSRIRSVPTAQIPADEGEHSVFVQLRNGPGLRSPVFRDAIVVDATPPELTPPTVSLRLGPMGSAAANVPIAVAWDAKDVHAGLSDATVSVSCGESLTQRTEAPGSARPDESVTWNAEAALFPDATCEVTAIARDGAGNRSRATSGGIRAALAATTDGDRLSAEVQADQVGVIARRGPDAGRIAISIDGESIELVDLYAAVAGGPELVYVAKLDGESRTVAVEPTGTADPASSGTSVSVDGLISLGSGA